MNLYNKYRPTEFEDVIGNEASIASLEKSLAKKDHSHVYMLSGPPGTGKTTIARIAASKLGASEIDIREINSANARGIDTAREIIQQMRYNPSDGDAIVYILDECQKFTGDMQSALLKPLEDTPDHVYFFLCTTDPGKIIKAIKSRCTEVKTTALPEEKLQLILRRINKLESLKVPKEIIASIASKCDGSPRNAIVMLEQVSNVEDEADINRILESKGSEDDPEIIELARMLLSGKSWKDISTLLKKLKENGKLDEPETVRYIVLGYMNSVLLSGNINKRAVIVMEAFSEPTYNTGKAGITLACLNCLDFR